jgi:hypothetical protein
MTKIQREIISKYLKLARLNKRHPSLLDMREEGVTRARIRNYFGSLTDLKKFVKEEHPTVFKNVIDEDIFNAKYFENIKEKVKKHNKVVVTSAVPGCPINEACFNNLKLLCKKENAILLVMPTSGDFEALDPALANENIVIDDLVLNSNLFLCNIKIPPKNQDPSTGLDRIAQRHGKSVIAASPKQRLKMVPTSNVKIPRAVMTTGCITEPFYTHHRYVRNRMAYFAGETHEIGGLIIELDSNEKYYCRRLKIDNKNAIVDLGRYYNKQVQTMNPEVFVAGDWHSGYTNQKVKSTCKEICEKYKIKKLVIHDLFNGDSICHHDKNKKLLRAIKVNEKRISLEEELKIVVNELREMSQWVDEVVIVKSNHDEWLDDYLEEGRFLDEPENLEISLVLAKAKLEGKDPLKFAAEYVNGKKFKNITWLKRDEDHKYHGIQLGAHGDVGPNGSRGSPVAMERAYGNVIYAHGHTPDKNRDAHEVGTFSEMRIGYNHGASSWCHTGAFVYPNAVVQLVSIFDGKYTCE